MVASWKSNDAIDFTVHYLFRTIITTVENDAMLVSPFWFRRSRLQGTFMRCAAHCFCWRRTYDICCVSGIKLPTTIPCDRKIKAKKCLVEVPIVLCQTRSRETQPLACNDYSEVSTGPTMTRLGIRRWNMKATRFFLGLISNLTLRA